MSQCVPTWDIDESPTAAATGRNSLRAAAKIPMLEEYEVAELRWENGQVALQGLGGGRNPAASGGGTLESIVKGARRRVAAAEAVVPVGSEAARGEWSSSSSLSGKKTMDTFTYDMGFTSTTSMGSLDNNNNNNTSSSSKPPSSSINKSSLSTKTLRAAAIHNQSERKRRDKINQRMKTLQKLVPNSSKTDKASMLDEVIEYLKQLQAQVSMMNRMNMPSMMLPMAMQQQLQMSMMSNPMGLGMGMGMGLGVMDFNSMNRAAAAAAATAATASNIMPNPFMPSWDANDPRYQSPLMPDPMITTLLSSQSQPMSMDAYTRMAALYQQMQQQLLPQPSNPK